jgi:hypothetical protein
VSGDLQNRVETGTLSPRERYLVLAAAFLGWMFAGFQMITMPLVTPAAMRDFLAKNPNPTLGDAVDKTKEAYRDNDPRIKAVQPKEKQDAALDCMELILMAYLQYVAEEVPDGQGGTRPPTNAEMRATTLRGPSY